jgi:hypothetical protein
MRCQWYRMLVKKFEFLREFDPGPWAYVLMKKAEVRKSRDTVVL